jgi:hypothetical protein
MVFDAGSTDGSAEIIAKYVDRIKFIQGETGTEEGQALKGLLRSASGEIVASLGPQERYLPWTFSVVGEIFSVLPKVEWLSSTTRLILDNRGLVCRRQPLNLKKGILLARESAFWRRALWQKAADDFARPRSAILHATEIPLAAASISGLRIEPLFIPFYKKVDFDTEINNWIVCRQLHSDTFYKLKFFARKFLLWLKLFF